MQQMPSLPCVGCGVPFDPVDSRPGRTLGYARSWAGTLDVTHHEAPCPGCGVRNVWHERKVRWLAIEGLTRVTCTCEEIGKRQDPGVIAELVLDHQRRMDGPRKRPVAR